MFSLKALIILTCWVATTTGFAPPICLPHQIRSARHDISSLSSKPYLQNVLPERSSRRSGILELLAQSFPPPPPPPRRTDDFEENEERRRRRNKSKSNQIVEPQAGLWREDLGLGLGRLSTENKPNPKPKTRARDKFGKKKPERPPPPMLTRKEWEAAALIGGAKDVWELGNQFLLAVDGKFEELELDWHKKGASRKEIQKRLGNAHRVRKEAEVQAKKAEDVKTFAKSWAGGTKTPKPPTGVFFRYMTKQVQEDGKVLPMSATRESGVREEAFGVGAERFKLMSASKGGSDNQKRLQASKSGRKTTGNGNGNGGGKNKYLQASRQGPGRPGR